LGIFLFQVLVFSLLWPFILVYQLWTKVMGG
jgi:hypothetical protein